MFLKVSQTKPLLDISWNAKGGTFATYQVNFAYVQQASAKVRAVLDKLTQSYDLVVHPRTGKLHNQTLLMPILGELATAGKELCDLFLDSSGSGKTRAALKRDIAKLRLTDKELNVLVTADIAIPFGLMFDLDPDDLAETAQGVFDQGGFWGSSLQISGMSALKENLNDDYSGVLMLPLINKDEFKQATSGLGAPSASDVNKLLDRPLKPTYTIKGFRERIREASDSSTIVYFYGHCANQTLHLSKTEGLAAFELNNRLDELRPFDKNEDSIRSVLFLNACYTGVSDEGNGFLAACHRSGLSGFIGSEANLPGRFAIRYGHEFLTQLVDKGLSIGETTSLLTEKFWPYSLLYCSYANPDFRVRRPAPGSTPGPQPQGVSPQPALGQAVP